MKKSETIALYADEYLKGKSDDDRRLFYEKPLEKQYSAVMAWKRRRDLSAGNSNLSSPAAIAESIKRIAKAIADLETLSSKDAERMHSALEEALHNIENFDRIKKSRLLQELESEKERIARQSENLERKIEALKQELC